MYLVDKLTPLTPKEACRAFAVHLPLDPHVLACHVAQSALETGHWKSLHWFNFGNVKATPKWDGDVTCFGCNEIINGKVVWFHPGPEVGWPGHDVWLRKHPTSVSNTTACKWRAFPTAEDGVAQQLAFLKSRPRSWSAAAIGDPEGFARALKTERYYTADVEHYTKLLKSLWNTYYYQWCLAAVDFEQQRRRMEQLSSPAGIAIPVLAPPVHKEDNAERQVVTDGHLALLPLKVDWDAMDAAKRREVAGYDDGLTSD